MDQRSLTGSLIGHYRVLDKLGEGGMGIVYKARDTRLDRIVALKILPAEAVDDADRTRRFVHEARAASALNHPNIVTVYDIQDFGGIHVIAMELVEGTTLADLIGRRGLSLKQLLDLAAQLADAVSAAHARGLLHRDLKPGNVMVAASGLVKVVDFGLAKLLPDFGESASTFTAVQTGEGRIIGTAAYMSPEQAEGKPVDARSDVFSFGSILYEMATGRRAFAGESTVATLSSVLHHDPPPICVLAPSLPRELERITELCLRKDPQRRFHCMADVKLQIQTLREEYDSGTLILPADRSQYVPWRWAWVGAVAVAVAVAATTAGFYLWAGSAALPAVSAAALTRLTYEAGWATDPAVSRDGRLLAYASDRAGAGYLDIWVQQIGGGDPVRLTRDAGQNRAPSFSPDGTRIVLRSTRDGGGIYLMPALGGAARRLAPIGEAPVFSPDGQWVAYSTGSQAAAVLANGSTKLWVVNTSGGALREVPTRFSGVCCPIWMPDGKHLLFLGNRDASLPLEESLDWWVMPLDGGEPTKTGALPLTRALGLSGRVDEAPMALTPGAWAPRGDAIVFSARSGDATNLWQLHVSPATFKATGEPLRLTSGTALEGQPSTATLPDRGDRIVFSSLAENSEIFSLPVTRGDLAPAGPLQRLTDNSARDFQPNLSDDGKVVVFVSTRTGAAQVWTKDLVTGEEAALTSSATVKYGPLLTPDRSALVYSESGTWAIYQMRFSEGREEVIREAVGLANSWTPAGGLLYHDISGRVHLLETASRKTTLLLEKPGHRLTGARLSPDHQWLAFTAFSSGQSRVVLAPYRGAAPIDEREWIDVAEARSPSWSARSDAVYYVSERDGFACVWAQRLEPQSGRPLGAPVAILHEHSPQRSLTGLGLMQAVRDALVFTTVERTGSIWMAEWHD